MYILHGSDAMTEVCLGTGTENKGSLARGRDEEEFLYEGLLRLGSEGYVRVCQEQRENIPVRGASNQTGTNQWPCMLRVLDGT